MNGLSGLPRLRGKVDEMVGVRLYDSLTATETIKAFPACARIKDAQSIRLLLPEFAR